MSVKINFKQNMSGYYFVDNSQVFSKKEVAFIQNAVNEALKKFKEEKALKQQTK